MSRSCFKCLLFSRCYCAEGFGGRHCEIDNRGCSSNPCQHDAPCVPGSDNTYRCECPRGLQGYFFEINVDDCVNNECQHWSTCEDLIGILNNYSTVFVLQFQMVQHSQL